MATLYCVKDGPRGSDRTDQGREISATDLAKRLSSYSCRFLGNQPPQFNIDDPSDYYRHIVIEVSPDDDFNDKFGQPGFYIVADLAPSQAAFLYN